MATHDGEGWAERQRVNVPPGSDGPMRGDPECSHLQRDASEPLWLQRKGVWLSGEVMYLSLPLPQRLVLPEGGDCCAESC